MQLLSQNNKPILFGAAALMNCYGITTSLLWHHPGGDASLFDDSLRSRAVLYLYPGENNRITHKQ